MIPCFSLSYVWVCYLSEAGRDFRFLWVAFHNWDTIFQLLYHHQPTAQNIRQRGVGEAKAAAMSSGYGINGTGRCYATYKAFEKCMVRIPSNCFVTIASFIQTGVLARTAGLVNMDWYPG